MSALREKYKNVRPHHVSDVTIQPLSFIPAVKIPVVEFSDLHTEKEKQDTRDANKRGQDRALSEMNK
jgi:uncharacterized protein involved in high-affinity Fe2+ transport